MMKSKLVLIFSFICFFACEQELEIDLPEEAPFLSVTSFFGPGTDTAQFIHLYASYPILEDRNPNDQIVNDASIRIYEDDSLVAQPQFISSSSYLDFISISPFPEGFYVLETFEPKLGMNYTLEIQSEGFEAVRATTTIPEKVPITELEIYPEIITGVDNVVSGEAIQGRIVFQDPPVENYYLFKVNVIVTQSEGNENIHQPAQLILDNVELGLDDIEASGFEYYFRDATFNDRNYEINFLLSDFNLITQLKDSTFYEKVEVSVILQSLAFETYDYLISADLQEDTANDPFSQPVQIRTNIENGVGIFGGINEDHRILSTGDILSSRKE